MKKYSAIVFDLGNVLIPFNYVSVIEKFNSIKEGLGERFKKLYAENYHIHRNYEKGKLSDGEFLDIMTEWTENVVGREEFCRIYSNIFTLNHDVIALLPVLKKNYTLCLLSNTNRIHKEYGYKEHEFLKHFDKLFLSHEVGAIKPEEEIYRAVEDFTKAPSSEHLFIDDIPEYVEGAKKIGWRGIQFTGYDNLLRDFEIIGIKK